VPRFPRPKVELAIAVVLAAVLPTSRAFAQNEPPQGAPAPGAEPVQDAGDAASGRDASPNAPQMPDAAPSLDASMAPAAEPSRSEQQPPPAPAAGTGPNEVTVRGPRSEAIRLQRSAEAVNVIDTRRAKQETADMGEVLARSAGISVRRAGGLGTGFRFSLNGLQDDQIRFFLDGVPLERAGFPIGIANVPVNLVERVEVYRGVVPIRFGADALGGAVNLVSDTRYTTHLGASYQVGSFGTYRTTVNGRYRHESGFVAGASGFFDSTRNDYPVEVEVTDARGRTSPATVRRFHDAYRAYGATVETGFVDQPWARRLLVKGFASTYDKELQNNIVMTTPYGEVAYGETVLGATARYEQPITRELELEVVANYSHRTIDFVDRSQWVYDWFGRRVRERRVAGEIDIAPSDQTVWEDGGYGRALVKYAIAPEQAIRLSMTPALTTRTGEERLRADSSALDPLAAKSTLVTLVTGLEYELNLLDERLQNIAFVKDYVYSASGVAPAAGTLRRREHDDHAVGAGNALRYRFARWLFAKASYEYATRLPRADEVFGNAILVQPNLSLEPEVSHNVNVGPRVELQKSPIGDLTVDINGFLRHSDKLIVLLGTDRFLTYQNVYEARSAGLESALAWTVPDRWLAVDGALTFQDVRNVSNEGSFGEFEGDRVPNRPWLFGSWGARLRIPKLPRRSDTLEPFYHGRWVHSFYRGWESQGLREYKQIVDTQVTHDVGLSWTVIRELARITSTFEINNVTNARVYDFFGVQRPGRALFVKVTAEL